MYFPRKLTIQLKAKNFILFNSTSIQPGQDRLSGYEDDLVGANFTKLDFLYSI
jgi:hypothetical protein